MRPIVRDVVRVLRNPAVFVVLALLVVAGALAPLGASSPGPAQGALAENSLATGVSYSYSDGYLFGIVSFEGSGSVVPGVHVTLDFAAGNGTGTFLGQVNGVTDSQGLLELNWRVPPCRCVATINASDPHGGFVNSGLPLEFPPSSNLTALGSLIFPVNVGLFEGRPALLVAVTNGSRGTPPDTYLTYCAPFSYGTPSTCASHTIGAVTSTPQVFSINLPGPLTDSDMVNISLVTQNAHVIESAQIPYGNLDPTNPNNIVVTAAGSGLVSGIQTMSFLVSLAGALIGYVGYSRDRLNGSLDPVLALPITRTRLILSRYSSALVASAIGAAACGAILGVSISALTSVGLPASVWLGIIATFAAEALAFVGLSFLGAHLTRSSPLLLVVLVLLGVIFTVLWTPVASLASSSLGNSVSQVALMPLSPSQASVSIIGMVTNSLAGGPSPLFSSITNPGILSASVLAWILVPIALTWWLFRIRD
jgi:ABC-type transport system involved in multi-copper enzyme maturation permease subunit